MGSGSEQRGPNRAPLAVLLACGVAFGFAAAGDRNARAADWPQWRGPQRNGLSAETGLNLKWPAAGPRHLWNAQVGEGYSSVSVAGGRLYTMGNAGNQDTVWCLNAETGKQIWKRSYPSGSGDYAGPRATPTVDGKLVYTFGREGQAFCLDSATGKVVWSRNLKQELRAEEPRWGFAGSPLIEGDLVIYNVGTAGAALRKANGQVVWKSAPATAGYASPLAYTVGRDRAVAIFSAQGLSGVNPRDGRRLWQYPWPTLYDVNAADPIFSGDTVFISSNYNHGCALLRVSGNGATRLWENRNMRNHTNSCVLVGGAYYGNDEGSLACIDAKTGAQRWKQRGMGRGGLIAAEGNLLMTTERGELVVVRANPAAYTELARAKVLGGDCWTHPVLANGRLYCRNHQGELVCLDLKGK